MRKVVVLIVVVVIGGGVALGFWQKDERKLIEESGAFDFSKKDLSGLDEVGDFEGKNEVKKNDSKDGVSEDEIKNSLEDKSGEEKVFIEEEGEETLLEVREDKINNEEGSSKEILEQIKQQEEMMEAVKDFQ